MMNEDELRNQHAEDVHELARLRRDLARISAIIDKALNGPNEKDTFVPYVEVLIRALKDIHHIVE